MSPSVEPFNEAKYKALMDGLECSEIKLSMINKDFRIDSEYQQKIYLFDDYYLNRKNAKPIDCFVTDGQHGYHELDDNSSIHMLTAKNTKDWFADTIGSDLIAKWVDDNNKRSSLHEDDLVLSTRGSVGYCAIVKSDILPANIDQDVARIKILDCSFRPEYVLTYLNSRYGQNWMKRNQTGMVQQGLSLQKVREIPIPCLINSFQEIIASVITDAYLKKMQSQEYIKNADKIFIETINLNMPSDSNTSKTIKSINDSFKLSGRLDAEYYQPKYDMIENQLNSSNTVGSTCKIYDNNYIPIDNSIYQYIQLSNVDTFGGISTPDKILGKELPTRARRVVKEGQVIISSIEGSLQSCALITKELDSSLCSTGFYVIDSDEYNSETLLILFKSKPIQMLMKKRCSGTILTAISKEEFFKMPLPYIDSKTQKKIAEKVQKSFKLRKESKQMLECAVKAVEMAIESDENTAIMWLEQELEVF